jgi:CxxC motif-containing protein (DUF1111 family)
VNLHSSFHLSSALLVGAVAFALGGCLHSERQERTDVGSPAQVLPPESQADPALADLMVLESAGPATVFVENGTSKAFSMPAPNLTEKSLRLHNEGDVVFESRFVTGPGSGHPELEGLGPAYNNVSCIACHNSDGRGSLPAFKRGQDPLSEVKFGPNEALLLRISVDGPPGPNAPAPVPEYGGQLFQTGVAALRPESPGVGQAEIWMRFEASEFWFTDGDRLELRKPLFRLANAYNSRLNDADIRVSPRLAPPVFGLGLIEAIPEETLLRNADRVRAESEARGLDISGRPQRVALRQRVGGPNGWTYQEKPQALGRFGWKAGAASLEHQTLAALAHDMGVTSYLFPIESIAGTSLWRDYVSRTEPRQSSNDPEAGDRLALSLVWYTQTLGVPARRGLDRAEVREGAQIFRRLECASCHTPSFDIAQHPEFGEFSSFRITPFSDFMLHDMGEGLADQRADAEATGREWRTPPLWGLGLTKVVNPRASFLHDGRARTPEEAIAWHGGEAEFSREGFRRLSRTERAQLAAFLHSL